MAESRFFRLRKNAGDHTLGTGVGGDQRTYKAGEVIETDLDLMRLFPNKFVELTPDSRHAKDKFGSQYKFPRLKGEPPVRGLPTKRTNRPAGPEETPNTEEEIMEVDQAREDGDTEEYPDTIDSVDEKMEGQGKNRIRGSKALLKHQKKKGRISDEDETEEVDDPDRFDDEEEDEEEPRMRKKKRAEEEEDEEEDAAESPDEDDEEATAVEDDEEEEEEAPAPKKMKSSKKKSKKSKKHRE